MPGIQNRCSRVAEITDVAEDDGKVIVKYSRDQQAVNHRQSSSRAPCFPGQQTPSLGDASINRKNSPAEGCFELNAQPGFQMRPPPALGQAQE